MGEVLDVTLSRNMHTRSEPANRFVKDCQQEYGSSYSFIEQAEIGFYTYPVYLGK